MAGVNALAWSDRRSGPSTAARGAPVGKSNIALLAYVPFALVTVATVGLSLHLRWSLASTLPWQCDEVPLLVRFTGLCGHATNEAEAAEFTPSFYSFRMGALRSLRVPNDHFAVHTSTGFWANLTLHLFGYGPGAGRAGPFLWSIVAVVAVAWAAWLAVRSVPAACSAAWLVALSPAGVAYGAQARGFAEALALTPLLLIALEAVRRRPDRWLRASLAFVCALQLSLTIYTMWVYWVLPVMVLAIVVLPRGTADPRLRRVTRIVLIVSALGLAAFMAIYTADRWKQLTFTASTFGVRFDRPGQIAWFLDRLTAYLLPAPLWLAVPALIGIVVLWRSPVRWWLGAFGVAVAVVLLFAILHGSAGFVRNLLFLLGPMAILFGLGVDAVLRRAAARWRPSVVAIVAGLAIFGASAWAYAGLERRARDILLPDWGALTVALNEEPETVGPRWLCPCPANHWQINWYRGRRDDERFLSVPPEGRIEVVMGAQRDEHGRATIYRIVPTVDGPVPKRGGIRPEPLPAYLAAIAPDEIRSGVAVRRWIGTRRSIASLASLPPEVPVFILARAHPAPSKARWDRFLTHGQAYERGVVTFKSLPVRNGGIQSMIAPAAALGPIVVSMQNDLGLEPAEIRLFALTPLAREEKVSGIPNPGSTL